MRALLSSLLLTCAAAGIAAESSVPLPGDVALRPAHQTPGTAPARVAENDAAPLIQIAVLLDTSSSMNGLINQARSQLWNIVNRLSSTARDGRRPELQVALYEYGNSRIAAEEQHVRQVLPFTTDLDRVSEQLFSLTTNGGDEYCGAVIRAATRGLTWSANPNDLKVMIIAGNEPFTQGAADYRACCVEAVAAHTIVINTIFCGPSQEGINTNWQDGAKLGNGSYAAIDHLRAVVVPPTPQDDELIRLGTAINATYVPYGKAGHEGEARQKAQDANSLSISPNSSGSRAASKASGNYHNERWDLVDAVERKTVVLEALAANELPEGMRALTPEQRTAYLAGKLAERKTMQARIGKLVVEREKFLATQVKAGAPALDDAIIAAILGQATRLGFTVP